MSEWTNFMRGKMGPYMKKYGSHAKAIRALSRDFKKSKEKSRVRRVRRVRK